MHLVGSLLDCIDAFDPDTVGSDPSIQAGSGLRCGRYRGPPCSQLPWKHHLLHLVCVRKHPREFGRIEGPGNLCRCG